MRPDFKRFLLIAHQNERIYQHTSMRSYQKAVPYWKMNDFSRFSGDLMKMTAFQGKRWAVATKKSTFHIEKLTIFRVSVNSRLHRGSLEFRILEFWFPWKEFTFINSPPKREKSFIFQKGTTFWWLRIDLFW